MKLARAHLALVFCFAAGCTPEAPPGSNGGGGGGGGGAPAPGAAGSGGGGGTPGTAGSGGSTGNAGSGGSAAGAGGGTAGSGGSAGTPGNAGTGGSRAPDARPGQPDGRPADAAPRRDGGVPDRAPPSSTPPQPQPPLTPCTRPSVDRLEIWEAHGGSLRPPVGGNLLVKEGDSYFMRVEFLPGAAFHEIVVPLDNSLARKVDLTGRKGVTIVYSSTADISMQLRPISFAHGGEQYAFALTSTGGMMRELFIPLEEASWRSFLFGPAPFPFAQALRDANFFNFVGRPAIANTFIVRGLRIDGHAPACTN
jgi:hypothetical protein